MPFLLTQENAEETLSGNLSKGAVGNFGKRTALLGRPFYLDIEFKTDDLHGYSVSEIELILYVDGVGELYSRTLPSEESVEIDNESNAKLVELVRREYAAMLHELSNEQGNSAARLSLLNMQDKLLAKLKFNEEERDWLLHCTNHTKAALEAINNM